MDKEYMEDLLERFKDADRFPDGRIDYHGCDTVPVLNAFINCKDEFLLLKRSDKVGTYQGMWNTIGGYLDEPVSVEDKVFEELREEIGVTKEQVSAVVFADPFEVHDESIPKCWIVHPVLVELKEKPKITLDWEHTECRWMREDEFRGFDVVPGFFKAFEKLKELLK